MTDTPIPAVSCVVIHDDTVLLVLRGRPPAADMWAFPGGRVEADETKEEAVLRELAEETGLKGENPRALASYHLGGPERFHLTVFRVDVGAIGALAANDDAADARFFALGETSALPMAENVRAVLTRLEGEGALTGS